MGGVIPVARTENAIVVKDGASAESRGGVSVARPMVLRDLDADAVVEGQRISTTSSSAQVRSLIGNSPGVLYTNCHSVSPMHSVLRMRRR